MNPFLPADQQRERTTRLALWKPDSRGIVATHLSLGLISALAWMVVVQQLVGELQFAAH